jgi:hypothetical protein
MEMIRAVGGSAVPREGKELFRFEVASKTLRTPLKLFAESQDSRKDWIALLRGAALAAALQKEPSTNELVAELRQKHQLGPTTLGITVEGTTVASIAVGSPAARAAAAGSRIEAGDTLAALGGSKLDAGTVALALSEGPPGERVSIKVRSVRNKTTFEAAMRRADAARVQAVAAVAARGEAVLEAKRAGKEPSLQQLLDLVKGANQARAPLPPLLPLLFGARCAADRAGRAQAAARDAEVADAASAHAEALEAALTAAAEEAARAQQAAGQAIFDLQERCGALQEDLARLAGPGRGAGAGGASLRADVAPIVRESLEAAFNKARAPARSEGGRDGSPTRLRAQIERLQMECAALKKQARARRSTAPLGEFGGRRR